MRNRFLSALLLGSSIIYSGCLSPEEELAECLVEKDVYVIGSDYECGDTTLQKEELGVEAWDILENQGHYINCVEDHHWANCLGNPDVRWTQGDWTIRDNWIFGVKTNEELSTMYNCPYDH